MITKIGPQIKWIHANPEIKPLLMKHPQLISLPSVTSILVLSSDASTPLWYAEHYQTRVHDIAAITPGKNGVYLEEKHPEPSMQPENAVMKALAWLIFNYGTEGLFLECQHYRWNFKESANFAGADIGRALGGADNLKAIESYGTNFQDMKKRFPEKVGITKETIPAIEKSGRHDDQPWLEILISRMTAACFR